MKLSGLIEQAQDIIAQHGDLEVIDFDLYSIGTLVIYIASPNQLEYWGLDLNSPNNKFVQFTRD